MIIFGSETIAYHNFKSYTLLLFETQESDWLYLYNGRDTTPDPHFIQDGLVHETIDNIVKERDQYIARLLNILCNSNCNYSVLISSYSDHWWHCPSFFLCYYSSQLHSTFWMKWMQLLISLTLKTLAKCCEHTFIILNLLLYHWKMACLIMLMYCLRLSLLMGYLPWQGNVLCISMWFKNCYSHNVFTLLSYIIWFDPL